jgi:predicted phage baseplate assembly protein
MPLMLPPADERTFASLVSDARARLPRLAPQWTDHNAHDPGITLIELLAHLTETDLYRLGRVTAAERRGFQRWFGVEAAGPSVAETVLALSFPATTGPGLGPFVVRNDREISSRTGDVTFSTTAAVTVQPSRIAALATADRRIFTGIPSTAAAILEAPALALGPQGKDALVIALDGPVSGNLSLYLWTGAPDLDADVRRRMREEALCVQRDRHRANRRCPASRFDRWRQHYEVDVVWEAGTANGWVPISKVHDRTRALTISGFVRLKMEAVLTRGAAAAAPTAYALRVRAVRGRYEIPPVLQGVLVNAVPARHQSRRFRIPLGRSTGGAGQRWRVPRSADVPTPGGPLVFDRTAVFVTETGNAGDKWTVASDFDRAGHDSAVAVVDADAGEVRFGDGYQGRVPPAGTGVELVSRLGGGPAGNIAAHTLTRFLNSGAEPSLAVDQLFPAQGGSPAPAPAELQARVLGRLVQPSRAVTLGDFERLTRDTPGVRVGRAHAVADHHPDCPGLPARGCVTVVVIPDGVGTAPEPTRGLLSAVKAYLGRRRPVATELHVVAPTYKKVAVQARLHLFSYVDAAAVILAARTRLDGFFHPLNGGFDGRGWPVGRDVYRSEVLALLQETPGVHHVEDLFLLVGANREPRCHNVPVCPTDLIATMPHDLTIDAARIR